MYQSVNTTFVGGEVEWVRVKTNEWSKIEKDEF